MLATTDIIKDTNKSSINSPPFCCQIGVQQRIYYNKKNMSIIEKINYKCIKSNKYKGVIYVTSKN